VEREFFDAFGHKTLIGMATIIKQSDDLAVSPSTALSRPSVLLTCASWHHSVSSGSVILCPVCLSKLSPTRVLTVVKQPHLLHDGFGGNKFR